MNSVQSTGHASSLNKKDSQIEELVASSPGQRNWRGIFIALLVIAAVLGLIVFSIFLLSPEDEGARVKGRRITLSDVNGNGLKWKPFNGTWINDHELVYRDIQSGLSILNLDTMTVKVLMTNSTFRQLNAEKFKISPDLKYVLLISDSSSDGARYNVFDVQTQNTFVLSPKEGVREAPKLQHVIWAPNTSAKKNLNPLTITNSELLTSSNSISSSSSSSTSDSSSSSSNSMKTTAQAIAFVHENDLYYKPKVQNDLVCRITTNGEKDKIYNGIPDWLYANTPELKGETIAFSTDGLYLSYMLFNDSLVEKYEYTWLGDNHKYPEVKSIRYPKANTINPNVTIYIVDLTVLKFINKIQLKPPADVQNNSYVGNMIWITSADLSVTFTNREQTSALTVICRAPNFNCREIHTETIVDNGWVLPADKPIFSKREQYFKHNPIMKTNETITSNNVNKTTLDKAEFEIGGFMLKRLPVRDGEHGYYRHIVFVSTIDMRTIPLTMGQFEVTELLGWDEQNEIVYFMATPELKPGQRHLYKIDVKLNMTEKSNRFFIQSSQPTCLTCDNNLQTFNLRKLGNFSTSVSVSASSTSFSYYDDNLPHNGKQQEHEQEHEQEQEHEHEQNHNTKPHEIPNNCLYNKIYFSEKYTYYVQECLGPNTPSIYLVETQTSTKILILHNGVQLRNRLGQLALPQIRTFSVEIRYNFHAQVRLFLPPGMKEEEEMAFPLILHIDAAPGSQLVSEKYEIDWNWYLCSQKSMIVAQIDGRGSGFQGELLRTQIKSKLGSVEIEDQLGVLTYLRDNFKFIDPTRICAYGWGYGGYAASMLLATDSHHVLQCAVAINPIVSFGYHSSFFTERFISQNDDYLRSLQDSDLSMRSDHIDARNYLLIHGTADTDVHQQHALLLTRALVDQGVAFRHQVYTDENHHLSRIWYHLFKTVDWFIEESFGPIESTEWDPTGFFAFKQPTKKKATGGCTKAEKMCH